MNKIEAQENDIHDLRCEVCGQNPYNCICPVCPECLVQGDPFCYRSHGLTESEAQKESLQQSRNQELWNGIFDPEPY